MSEAIVKRQPSEVTRIDLREGAVTLVYDPYVDKYIPIPEEVPNGYRPLVESDSSEGLKILEAHLDKIHRKPKKRFRFVERLKALMEEADDNSI